MVEYLQSYYGYGMEIPITMLALVVVYYIGKYAGYRSMVRQHRRYEQDLMSMYDLTMERERPNDVYEEHDGLSEEQADRLAVVEALQKQWIQNRTGD